MGLNSAKKQGLGLNSVAPLSVCFSQTRNLIHQQPVNNQRTPTPTIPAAAVPTLQKVLEEAIDQMQTVEVSGRLEVPVQTSDAQSDPPHVYINYAPLADSNINSKSAETKVTVPSSDPKSNSDDQDCIEPDRAGPNLHQSFITMSSDELPFVTQLQN